MTRKQVSTSPVLGPTILPASYVRHLLIVRRTGTASWKILGSRKLPAPPDDNDDGNDDDNDHSDGSDHSADSRSSGHGDRSDYSLTVGRTRTCDIMLNGDPLISQKHCRIQRTGDHFTVWDLGTTNGTYINGNRLPTNGRGVLLSNGFVAAGNTLLYPADRKVRPFLAVPTKPAFERLAAKVMGRSLARRYGIHPNTATAWRRRRGSSNEAVG